MDGLAYFAIAISYANKIFMKLTIGIELDIANI
jgi:hypothetical protein